MPRSHPRLNCAPRPQRRAPLERGAMWAAMVPAPAAELPQRRARLERGAIGQNSADCLIETAASTKGSSGKRSDPAWQHQQPGRTPGLNEGLLWKEERSGSRRSRHRPSPRLNEGLLWKEERLRAPDHLHATAGRPQRRAPLERGAIRMSCCYSKIVRASTKGSSGKRSDLTVGPPKPTSTPSLNEGLLWKEERFQPGVDVGPVIVPQRRAPLERGAIRGGGRSSGWSRSLNEGLLWKEERCGVEASPSSLGLASTKGSSGKRSDGRQRSEGADTCAASTKGSSGKRSDARSARECPPQGWPQRRAPLERGAIRTARRWASVAPSLNEGLLWKGERSGIWWSTRGRWCSLNEGLLWKEERFEADGVQIHRDPSPQRRAPLERGAMHPTRPSRR